MAEARRFAESIGAHSVLGMCLARNAPMRQIFANAGMTMTREDDEVHACCTVASRRTVGGAERDSSRRR